jgi:hypothetical protein
MRVVLVGLGAVAAAYGAAFVVLGAWVFGLFLFIGGLAMIHWNDEEWAYFGLAHVAARDFLRGRQRSMYVERHIGPPQVRPRSFWWFALSIVAAIVGSACAVAFWDGSWIWALIVSILLTAFQLYVLVIHWHYRRKVKSNGQ